MTATIPLFPLHTVLFPGGRLKLRIFEMRYVDMVGRCMREGVGFGVASIVEGVEAGGSARTRPIGTMARIIDFERLQDGLLGITCAGEERFRIESTRQQDDGLHLAEVTPIPAEPAAPISAEHESLAELMQAAFPQLRALYTDMQPDYENASWVGMRLAEILPLPAEDRQRCLEFVDAQERLHYLSERVRIDRV